eukprot:206471-Rhodomonas_salina.1
MGRLMLTAAACMAPSSCAKKETKTIGRITTNSYILYWNSYNILYCKGKVTEQDVWFRFWARSLRGHLKCRADAKLVKHFKLRRSTSNSCGKGHGKARIPSRVAFPWTGGPGKSPSRDSRWQDRYPGTHASLRVVKCYVLT